jgi:Protein kinase domain
MRLTNEYPNPVVQRLLQVKLDGNEYIMGRFIAVLAILLSDIFHQCNSAASAIMDGRPDLESSNSLSDKSKSKPKPPDRPKPPDKPRPTDNAKPERRTGGSSNNSSKMGENEAMAMAMASLNGKIHGLHYPWSRVKNAAALDLWGHDRAFYQQESPFYFKGFMVDGQNNDAVFCKVWRECDDLVDPEDVKNEIDLFKVANANDIPSALVIEKLTCMYVDYVRKDTMQTMKYHILVTTYERNDQVAPVDLFCFALSLIQTVKKLHACGILHCDIKPRNVLWDATQGVARLVDFGHAQYESAARAYKATKKYQAPEISQGEKHTRKSDAFGVGRTIEVAIKSASGVDPSNGTNVLNELVDLLLAKDRICLNEAETRLQLALREKEESAGIVPSQQEYEVLEKRKYQVQQVESDGIA